MKNFCQKILCPSFYCLKCFAELKMIFHFFSWLRLLNKFNNISVKKLLPENISSQFLLSEMLGSAKKRSFKAIKLIVLDGNDC